MWIVVGHSDVIPVIHFCLRPSLLFRQQLGQSGLPALERKGIKSKEQKSEFPVFALKIELELLAEKNSSRSQNPGF